MILLRHSIWFACLAMAAVLVDVPASAGEATRLDCAYSPKGIDDVLTFKACASVASDGSLRLQHRHLRALRFDRHRLASLFLGKDFYYVMRDGRLAPVMALDNWAEEFHDGRARSPRRGKIGFIDRSLRLAIPAVYDGALWFENGRAAVCRACAIKKDGEDSVYVGGLWACVDTAGREVVPLRPSARAIDCSASQVNPASVGNGRSPGR